MPTNPQTAHDLETPPERDDAYTRAAEDVESLRDTLAKQLSKIYDHDGERVQLEDLTAEADDDEVIVDMLIAFRVSGLEADAKALMKSLGWLIEHVGEYLRRRP